MGKLSINVPADMEQDLRRRAKAEGTTISALLTGSYQRDTNAARNIAEARTALEEAITEQGPVTTEEKTEIAAFLEDVENFRAQIRERAQAQESAA